jgi:hypothetical protein
MNESQMHCAEWRNRKTAARVALEKAKLQGQKSGRCLLGARGRRGADSKGAREYFRVMAHVYIFTVVFRGCTHLPNLQNECPGFGGDGGEGGRARLGVCRRWLAFGYSKLQKPSRH